MVMAPVDPNRDSYKVLVCITDLDLASPMDCFMRSFYWFSLSAALTISSIEVLMKAL